MPVESNALDNGSFFPRLNAGKILFWFAADRSKRRPAAGGGNTEGRATPAARRTFPHPPV